MIGAVTQSGGPWSVSAASLPLPSNAAQETGGNLAAVATVLTSPDVPLVVALAGDPAGNYPGVNLIEAMTVSYTHLTLPTILRV